MKNKIITFFFLIIIYAFFLANILTPDKDISYSERRKLTSLSDVKASGILNKDSSETFLKYTLDQFILREEFRTLKTLISFNLYKKLDNNNLYYKDGYIYKIEYPLNGASVNKFGKKINAIYNSYLDGMDVYYSIIPEKNYYSQDEYLKLDYKKMFKLIKNNIDSHIKYIDITEDLNINSYYKTDIHWKQESLNSVVKKLANHMNFSTNENFKEETYEPFYGSYYGQLGLKMTPDTLKYLHNDQIDKAKAIDKFEGKMNIYDESSLGSIDSYNVFLGGAKAIIEIINDEAPYDKELIIFRDSFGSSLAPLLIPCYKKITLIDLRYISTKLIKDYIDFNNQQVLFLYNTTIINNSDIIK